MKWPRSTRRTKWASSAISRALARPARALRMAVLATARAALAACLILAATQARAHGMRTAYLELVEGNGDEVLAEWKTTVADHAVVPGVAGCDSTGAEPAAPSPLTRAFVLHCPGGLEGREVSISGLGPVIAEAVVRIARPDASVRSHVLTAREPRWVVPLAGSSALEVARGYVTLGIGHILGGYDHLLFLLALCLWVRRPRDVILTETAFTVSHSLSFSATALGWIHVSAPAAEACIALSLVLVALDSTDPRARDVARRQAPAVALVFGLVHGLGFAGALSEVGLPDRAIATALLGFGMGVEIGQVAFLAAVLGALAVLERTRWTEAVAWAGSMLVGVTGSYWLFARLTILFA